MEELRSQPDNPWSRLWGVFLMASILLVAGILSALTAMRYAIRGTEVTVPDVSGRTESEAAQALAAAGLEVRVAGKRFHPKTAEGRVIEQNPAPGTSLKANRTVRVLVSLGDRQSAVPNLVGSSLRAVQLSLVQRRLTLGSTLYAHTTDAEPFVVAYQSPTAGSTGGSDPTVDVLISLGRTSEEFVMPDLIGLAAEPVIGRIQNEGFRVGKVTARRYPGVEPGVVLQQQPAAGSRVRRSEPVQLEVSQ